MRIIQCDRCGIQSHHGVPHVGEVYLSFQGTGGWIYTEKRFDLCRPCQDTLTRQVKEILNFENTAV
jgi:hypothetical protein